MNLVKKYYGTKETIDHYRLYPRSQPGVRWVSISPDSDMVQRVEIIEWYIDHENWLGMTQYKYIQIATKGIDHYIDRMTGLYYDTLQDCQKAIRNLAEYLFKRDY
jgi:hypothetical protein